MSSMMSIELKLELLNQKVDKMINLFEKTMTILEKKKSKREDDITTEWSIEEYRDSILVKFSYNEDFKNYIKEIGGMWLIGKKAWMFPKSKESQIKALISEKYNDWTFTKVQV